jgi:hypothetical protein
VLSEGSGSGSTDPGLKGTPPPDSAPASSASQISSRLLALRWLSRPPLHQSQISCYRQLCFFRLFFPSLGRRDAFLSSSAQLICWSPRFGICITSSLNRLSSLCCPSRARATPNATLDKLVLCACHISNLVQAIQSFDSSTAPGFISAPSASKSSLGRIILSPGPCAPPLLLLRGQRFCSLFKDVEPELSPLNTDRLSELHDGAAFASLLCSTHITNRRRSFECSPPSSHGFLFM